MQTTRRRLTGRGAATHLGSIVALTLLFGTPATTAQTDAIRWEPYETMGVDDQPLHGELGRLRVPEDRSKPDGATIELAFVRFPSENPDPGPPIVVLAGGPGGPGVEVCIGPATGRFVRLLQYGDVIGLDQRGTGLSVPNLSTGPTFRYALPLDEPATGESFVAATREASERCVAYWAEQGVDVSAYTTEASADDVEDLRVALGVEEVVLWGASYGTHLGLSVLRRHPEHIARAVLSRIEGPNHTLKLPDVTQFHLEQLGELVRADASWGTRMPDLVGTVRTLLERLERDRPTIEVELDGQREELVLGPFDLQFCLANTLGEAFSIARVPGLLEALDQGDWSQLEPWALWARRDSIGSAMSLAMDCASGATAERLRLIERQAADPANLLADAVNMPYPGSCSACGDIDLGDEFRSAFECDVPMLLTSGDLDARTPAANAEELLPGFPNAVHVLVENAGHESIEVMFPEYRELLDAFLRGEAIEGQTVTLPAPRFYPPEG